MRRREMEQMRGGGMGDMGSRGMQGGGGSMDDRRRMEMEQRRNADMFASVSTEVMILHYVTGHKQYRDIQFATHF